MTVDGEAAFGVDLDLLDHRLDLSRDDGTRWSMDLPGRSMAGFHQGLVAGLAALGIDAAIASPYPFDLPDSTRAFADDHEHTAYDPVAVTAYWCVLGQVNLLPEEFAGRFSGKASPVHHFWHTTDIAHTRFSDRVVHHDAGTDPVTREAYALRSRNAVGGAPPQRSGYGVRCRRGQRAVQPVQRVGVVTSTGPSGDAVA